MHACMALQCLDPSDQLAVIIILLCSVQLSFAPTFKILNKLAIIINTVPKNQQLYYEGS